MSWLIVNLNLNICCWSFNWFLEEVFLVFLNLLLLLFKLLLFKMMVCWVEGNWRSWVDGVWFVYCCDCDEVLLVRWGCLGWVFSDVCVWLLLNLGIVILMICMRVLYLVFDVLICSMGRWLDILSFVRFGVLGMMDVLIIKLMLILLIMWSFWCLFFFISCCFVFLIEGLIKIWVDVSLIKNWLYMRDFSCLKFLFV